MKKLKEVFHADMFDTYYAELYSCKNITEVQKFVNQYNDVDVEDIYCHDIINAEAYLIEYTNTMTQNEIHIYADTKENRRILLKYFNK